MKSSDQPEPGWFVRVNVQVEMPGVNRTGRTATLRRTLQIGPVSWTGAKRIAAAWEVEHGQGTALVTDVEAWNRTTVCALDEVRLMPVRRANHGGFATTR